MPGLLTEITELATALGTLRSDLDVATTAQPAALMNVPGPTWQRLVDAYRDGGHAAAFHTAFANGAALLMARDGLRGRRPRLAEWKGPHRPPGDDVIPADLRLDHVYLVSCKYLSRVMVNAGPVRLFDRLLVGEDRTPKNWFEHVAPNEFQTFYLAARSEAGLAHLPSDVGALTASQQQELRTALAPRALPSSLVAPWRVLCDTVAVESASRFRAGLASPRARLRLLWRLLRISSATYFVLGTDRTASVRLRVASAWDWVQAFELRSFDVAPRPAGQPEVGWQAVVRDRQAGLDTVVAGHVEIRWSHGRFSGAPEAKVYLDTPHLEVPGYYPLE